MNNNTNQPHRKKLNSIFDKKNLTTAGVGLLLALAPVLAFSVTEVAEFLNMKHKTEQTEPNSFDAFLEELHNRQDSAPPPFLEEAYQRVDVARRRADSLIKQSELIADGLGKGMNIDSLRPQIDVSKYISKPTKSFTVVLDAGHGGSDKGAVNGRRTESADNLKFTLALGKVLKEEYGVTVIQTREAVNTRFGKSRDRAVFASGYAPDLIASIHRNAGGGGTGVGVVIGNPQKRRRPAGERRVAEIINKSLIENWPKNNSAKNLMVEGIHTAADTLGIFGTDIPTVIAEVGYIDNAADNKYFDENFDKIVRAVADGIYNSLIMTQENSINQTFPGIGR